MTPPEKPRPPAPRPPSYEMHLTMPGALYDSTYAAARRDRMTVPEYVRHVLKEATMRAPSKP